MQISQESAPCRGILFSIKSRGHEVARATLYVLTNSHAQPFGLLEDVWVSEPLRGKGVGKKLVRTVVQAARRERCYKLIATSRFSRPAVHQLYEKLGFAQHGVEFRMNFDG